MPTWVLILIIVLSVIIVLGIASYVTFCLYISSMMANKMCKPKHFKSKEEKLLEVSSASVDGLNEYSRTPIQFKLSDGYIIHGDYSLNNLKKFVLCMHGHISNREGCVKYSYALYRLGYSVVFIDHRSHGENERGIVTMGYQEHKDALEVIEQIKDKFGKDIEIGLFGCSMGGVSALLCVKENQNLSFVVSDCAFAGMKQIVQGFIKMHHSMDFPILQLTNMFTKKRYHVSYKNVSPMEDLKENKRVPILFIHGTADDFVYPENAELLYNNDNGPKELVYFEGANHCGSITSDKAKYYRVVEEFINKYVGK